MSDRNIRFIESIVCVSIEIVLYSIADIVIEHNFGIHPTSFLIIMALVKSQSLKLDILDDRDRIEKLEREVIK
jgi:hypothetical protein